MELTGEKRKWSANLKRFNLCKVFDYGIIRLRWQPSSDAVNAPKQPPVNAAFELAQSQSSGFYFIVVKKRTTKVCFLISFRESIERVVKGQLGRYFHEPWCDFVYAEYTSAKDLTPFSKNQDCYFSDAASIVEEYIFLEETKQRAAQMQAEHASGCSSRYLSQH